MTDQEPDKIEFDNVDISKPKYVDDLTLRHRRSIVFITIADPQITLVDIEKMMETGMNIARFKTSHSTKCDKVEFISRVDRAASFLAQKYSALDWPCATCVELKTCVVQTGLLEQDVCSINIEDNTTVTLIYDISKYNKCNAYNIFVDNPYLTSDVKVGMEINIGQDEIIMKCTSIPNEKSVVCYVTKGGKLLNMAYVCMRGAKRTRPYLTKKDLVLIKFAVEYQVDMIVINYVRHLDTLKKIKQYLGMKLKRPLLVVGLCTPEGLGNIDDFVREADGVILSREFIAYELDSDIYNRMHSIQRMVAAKCLQAGKPFYVGGEMLSEALLKGAICTRELSDVTNALLQGASGIVLRETPNIDYLISTVKVVNDVCAGVEPVCNDKETFWKLLSHLKMPMNAAEATAMSCALVANQTNARCIIIPTVTGRTASLVNWLRPIAIIIAVSTRIRTTRLLKTYRGVIPLLYKGAPRRTWYSSVQARVQFAIQYAVEKHWLVFGDFYVTLEKWTEESSFCDTIRVWNVMVTRKNVIECPESYHDFTIDTYQETVPKTSKRKSMTLQEPLITKPKEDLEKPAKERTSFLTPQDIKEMKLGVMYDVATEEEKSKEKLNEEQSTETIPPEIFPNIPIETYEEDEFLPKPEVDEEEVKERAAFLAHHDVKEMKLGVMYDVVSEEEKTENEEQSTEPTNTT